MKNRFLALDEYMRAFIIDICFLLVLFLIMIPLFFTGWQEIPQGLLLGGLIGALPLLLFSITSKKDQEKNTMVRTIIIMVIRIVLITAVLVGVGFLYYKLEYKIFNLFATAGGYLVSTVALLVTSKDKRMRNGNI